MREGVNDRDVEAAAYNLVLDFGGPGQGQSMKLVWRIFAEAPKLGVSATQLFNEYEDICKRMGVMGKPRIQPEK